MKSNQQIVKEMGLCDCGWHACKSTQEIKVLSALDAKDQERKEAVANAIDRAAEIAFEKIRCDDRTDRWLVANEVAAHIRAEEIRAST